MKEGIENSVKREGKTMNTASSGRNYSIIAKVRYDDECGNGHNTFSITAEIWDSRRKNDCDSCGCLHNDIAKHFPELTPAIKWHLCSSDGPMHYIANTLYWVEEGSNLEHARRTAIWPEATDAQLTAEDLKERLEARLPGLMADFKKMVESFGFTY
jgi:hypothetical protein